MEIGPLSSNVVDPVALAAEPEEPRPAAAAARARGFRPRRRRPGAARRGRRRAAVHLYCPTGRNYPDPGWTRLPVWQHPYPVLLGAAPGGLGAGGDGAGGVAAGCGRGSTTTAPLAAGAIFLACLLGADHAQTGLAAAAVLPGPGRGARRPGRGPRGAAGEHVALAAAAGVRLRGRSGRRPRHRRPDRLVCPRPLLGHAGAELPRPAPRHGPRSPGHDAARQGLPVPERRRPDRLRGLVPGDHADLVGHRQRPPVVPRRGPHAGGGAALPDLPRRRALPPCPTSSSACSWGWAPRSSR